MSGTVESQRTPRILANNKTVISFLGKIIKRRNKNDLSEYKSANKFFFENRSPK